MAEQLLNHSQIGAAIEQMSGKTMAQAMGTHFDRNTGLPQMFLDDARHAPRGDAPPRLLKNTGVSPLQANCQLLALLRSA